MCVYKYVYIYKYIYIYKNYIPVIIQTYFCLLVSPVVCWCANMHHFKCSLLLFSVSDTSVSLSRLLPSAKISYTDVGISLDRQLLRETRVDV